MMQKADMPAGWAAIRLLCRRPQPRAAAQELLAWSQQPLCIRTHPVLLSAAAYVRTALGQAFEQHRNPQSPAVQSWLSATRVGDAGKAGRSGKLCNPFAGGKALANQINI